MRIDRTNASTQREAHQSGSADRAAARRPRLPRLSREQFGLAIAAAVCFALAFPTTSLWPLVILAPVFLTFAAVRAATWREIVIPVFAIHFLMWLWMHRWLIEVSIPGWPLLAAVLAVYPVVFVVLVRVLHEACGRRCVSLVWIIPMVWTGLEYFRGSLFMDGYPWYLLGQPLIEQPLLVQSADLFGIYSASFLAAMTAGWIVVLVRARRGHEPRRRVMIDSTIVAAILLGNVVYGGFRLRQHEWTATPGPVILAIQTNLPQDNKLRWEPIDQVRDFNSFVELSIDAWKAGNDDVDLIVWPETMAPGPGFEPQALAFMEQEGYFPGRRFVDMLLLLRDHVGVPLLVGSSARIGLGVEETPEGPKWTWERTFNAAYLIDRDQPPFPRYDKVFLTPFGETMPYISANWPWLEQRLMAIAAQGMQFDLDAAAEINRLELVWNDATVRIGTPICFEDTVPRFCRRMVYVKGEKRVDLLINLSNDGWFAWQNGGRLTHVQIARFRCIENRVPMVRAANTGLSISIDSNGKVITSAAVGRESGMQQAGWVRAEVMIDARTTLYSRIGNLLPLASLGTMLITVAWAGFSRRSARGTAA